MDIGEEREKRRVACVVAMDERARRQFDEEATGRRAPQPCRFFAQGKCHFGRSCRNSHGEPPAAVAAPAAAAPAAPRRSAAAAPAVNMTVPITAPVPPALLPAGSVAPRRSAPAAPAVNMTVPITAPVPPPHMPPHLPAGSVAPIVRPVPAPAGARALSREEASEDVLLEFTRQAGHDWKNGPFVPTLRLLSRIPWSSEEPCFFAADPKRPLVAVCRHAPGSPCVELRDSATWEERGRIELPAQGGALCFELASERLLVLLPAMGVLRAYVRLESHDPRDEVWQLLSWVEVSEVVTSNVESLSFCRHPVVSGVVLQLDEFKVRDFGLPRLLAMTRDGVGELHQSLQEFSRLAPCGARDALLLATDRQVFFKAASGDVNEVYFRRCAQAAPSVVKVSPSWAPSSDFLVALTTGGSADTFALYVAPVRGDGRAVFTLLRGLPADVQHFEDLVMGFGDRVFITTRSGTSLDVYSTVAGWAPAPPGGVESVVSAVERAQRGLPIENAAVSGGLGAPALALAHGSDSATAQQASLLQFNVEELPRLMKSHAASQNRHPSNSGGGDEGDDDDDDGDDSKVAGNGAPHFGVMGEFSTALAPAKVSAPAPAPAPALAPAAAASKKKAKGKTDKESLHKLALRDAEMAARAGVESAPLLTGSAATAEDEAEAEKEARLRARELAFNSKRQGDKHAKSKKWELALACYQRAASQDPSDANMLNLMADMQVALGIDSEASVTYRTALMMSPGNVRAQIGLGKLLLKAMSFVEAADAFKKALATDPRAFDLCKKEKEEADLMAGKIKEAQAAASAGEWLRAWKAAAPGAQRHPNSIQFSEMVLTATKAMYHELVTSGTGAGTDARAAASGPGARALNLEMHEAALPYAVGLVAKERTRNNLLGLAIVMKTGGQKRECWETLRAAIDIPPSGKKGAAARKDDDVVLKQCYTELALLAGDFNSFKRADDLGAKAEALPLLKAALSSADPELREYVSTIHLKLLVVYNKLGQRSEASASLKLAWEACPSLDTALAAADEIAKMPYDPTIQEVYDKVLEVLRGDTIEALRKKTREDGQAFLNQVLVARRVLERHIATGKAATKLDAAATKPAATKLADAARLAATKAAATKPTGTERAATAVVGGAKPDSATTAANFAAFVSAGAGLVSAGSLVPDYAQDSLYEKLYLPRPEERVCPPAEVQKAFRCLSKSFIASMLAPGADTSKSEVAYAEQLGAYMILGKAELRDRYDLRLLTDDDFRKIWSGPFSTFFVPFLTTAKRGVLPNVYGENDQEHYDDLGEFWNQIASNASADDGEDDDEEDESDDDLPPLIPVSQAPPPPDNDDMPGLVAL